MSLEICWKWKEKIGRKIELFFGIECQMLGKEKAVKLLFLYSRSNVASILGEPSRFKWDEEEYYHNNRG